MSVSGLVSGSRHASCVNMNFFVGIQETNISTLYASLFTTNRGHRNMAGNTIVLRQKKGCVTFHVEV